MTFAFRLSMRRTPRCKHHEHVWCTRHRTERSSIWSLDVPPMAPEALLRENGDDGRSPICGSSHMHTSTWGQ
jgi:hypothetical protein